MKERTRIELHCHTKKSAGKGMIEPRELVKYANDNGYRAIAITECGSVQAFPEVYQAWKDLWKKYEEDCKKTGEEARQEDFLKIIYGMEGVLSDEFSCLNENIHSLTDECTEIDKKRDKGKQKGYPVLLYAKNETGIRNLYKIVTESHLSTHDDEPTITKNILDKYRDGLLVGAVCDGGEVMTAIHTKLGSRTDAEYRRDISNILSYYDFIEVSPFGADKGNDVRYMYHETAPSFLINQTIILYDIPLTHIKLFYDII